MFLKGIVYLDTVITLKYVPIKKNLTGSQNLLKLTQEI